MSEPLYDDSELERLRLQAEITKSEIRWKAISGIAFWVAVAAVLITLILG